jgi:hypothetical protein
MARKHNRLYKADKYIAEKAFGPQPGRPTISTRAGRHISRTLNVNEAVGKAFWYLGLGILIGVVGTKALS